MARELIKIKVGTYTGNGVDSTAITGVGFRPNLVIVKGTQQLGVWRVRPMTGDSTALFGNGTLAADKIQEFLSDGFQVGTNAQVNTNGTVYYYLAMSGAAAQDYFRTGLYIGNGSDDRSYTAGGLGFTPDLFVTAQQGANSAVWRSSSHSGDATSYFGTTTNQTNRIQNLISNGFQLGTNAEVNGSASKYSFFAIKNIPGAFMVGTYTGTGVDAKRITGLGFQPDAVFVKGNVASNMKIKTVDMSGANSQPLAATTAADALSIASFISDGFTIGTDASVNTAGSTYYWWAFKSGSFNVPLNRLS